MESILPPVTKKPSFGRPNRAKPAALCGWERTQIESPPLPARGRCYGDTETGVIDIGVSRDGDDIRRFPAALTHFGSDG